MSYRIHLGRTETYVKNRESIWLNIAQRHFACREFDIELVGGDGKEVM